MFALSFDARRRINDCLGLGDIVEWGGVLAAGGRADLSACKDRAKQLQPVLIGPRKRRFNWPFNQKLYLRAATLPTCVRSTRPIDAKG